jgi:hypothetical protein
MIGQGARWFGSVALVLLQPALTFLVATELREFLALLVLDAAQYEHAHDIGLFDVPVSVQDMREKGGSQPRRRSAPGFSVAPGIAASIACRTVRR